MIQSQVPPGWYKVGGEVLGLLLVEIVIKEHRMHLTWKETLVLWP